MFDLDAFVPNNPDDLDKLAQSMTRTTAFYETPEPPINPIHPLEVIAISEALDNILESLDKIVESLDKDLQDSDIPAGYSYLGQFIIHDISFDEKTDRFDKTNYPWNSPLQPIKNLRRPFLDLENIYGREEIPLSRFLEENSSHLKLNNTLENTTTTGVNLSERPYPNDLLRKQNSAEADIIDPRNDENLLLAQTQVAFTKFHNAIVDKLGNPNSMSVFEKAKRMTIRHYQYIILNDFLPRIIKGGENTIKQIISEVQNGTNKFYNPTKDNMFLPLEFVVGAYRTAHSMIRHTYHLNKELESANQIATLRDIFLFTGRGRMNSESDIEAAAKIRLPSRWLVNWKWFYDIDNSQFTDKAFFNFARKLDTNISSALGRLAPNAKEKKANSLSALDLHRGVLWELPTGQSLAKEMKMIEPNMDEKIKSKFNAPLDSVQRAFFAENTPLLFYLLAEAEIQCEGKTLGDIGSQIFAETLIKLIYETPDSILKKGNELESDADFLPNDPQIFKMLGTDDRKTFGMPQMLKFIAESRKKVAIKPEENFDELNPLG